MNHRHTLPELEFRRDKAKFLALLSLLIRELNKPVPDDRMGDLRVVESTLAEIEDLELHPRLGFRVMPLYVTERGRDGRIGRYVIWNKPRSGGGEIRYESVNPGLAGRKDRTVRSTGMAEPRMFLVDVLESWVAETEALVSLPPQPVLRGHVQGANPRLASDAYHRCLEAAICKLETKPSLLRDASEAMEFMANSKLRLLHEHFLPGEPFIFGYAEKPGKRRPNRLMIVGRPNGEASLELPIGVGRPSKSHADQAAEIIQVLRTWQNVRRVHLGVADQPLPATGKGSVRRRLPDPKAGALSKGLNKLRKRSSCDRLSAADMLGIYGLEEVEVTRFIKSTRFVARGPNTKPHQLPKATAPRSRSAGGTFKPGTTWTQRQALAAAEGWEKKIGVHTDPF